MRPERFNIRDVIDRLDGSRMELSSALPDGMQIDELTREEAAIIDSLLFRCCGCNTWLTYGHSWGENYFTKENLCITCFDGDDE